MRMMLVLLVLFSSLVSPRADGPSDNRVDQVRPVPPPGIAVPPAVRTELEAELKQLGGQLATLRAAKAKTGVADFLPDVEVYHKAVRFALAENEFYSTNEFEIARHQLAVGLMRAVELEAGRAPWNSATGLVVRGYSSDIDGSVQPYGLVVPPTYHPNSLEKFRLDFWFHGRGETLTELNFIQQREKSPGEFVPPNTFVLHLYGRYCNANKFAGEMDLFEAYDHVRRHYPIDENRLIVRGFSMGGAACWHFAVHYAGLWAGAAPGAGFSETADFLKVFQNETVHPAWYEQKLWRWYDATDYALNLFNCPTVAYSGEIDRQKQAADRMAKALEQEGIRLVHIIGPQTPHRYHPEAKKEIDRRIDSLARIGRDPVPTKIRFTTCTLRYNRMFWTTVDALEQHWERARLEADLVDDHTLKLTTHNVKALSLDFPPGLCPLDLMRRPTVQIDGKEILVTAPLSDRSWTVHLEKAGRKWRERSEPEPAGLRKRHGLQGPIDDAFMERFVMVTPTRRPLNGKVCAWTDAEQAHAIRHWRWQFRGEPRVITDQQLSTEDIASSNLILWGDPSSNAVLGRIATQLPIRWDAQGVHMPDAIYPADRYVPVLIYPNPLNPRHYVVLNSGFTFREYDYLNNARQVPKLPDYAILDLNDPMTARAPGGVSSAGFFNEQWELPRK